MRVWAVQSTRAGAALATADRLKRQNVWGSSDSMYMSPSRSLSLSLCFLGLASSAPLHMPM